MQISALCQFVQTKLCGGRSTANEAHLDGSPGTVTAAPSDSPRSPRRLALRSDFQGGERYFSLMPMCPRVKMRALQETDLTAARGIYVRDFFIISSRQSCRKGIGPLSSIGSSEHVRFLLRCLRQILWNTPAAPCPRDSSGFPQELVYYR